MSYYVEKMDQLKMKGMRDKHPDWIWNRSDTHAFLAIPEEHDAFTTVVEPGNSFSPGPGTYGVSTWVRINKLLFVPEELPLENMGWRFKDKRYPILETHWQADGVDVHSELFAWKAVDTIDFRNYLRVSLTNHNDCPLVFDFFLVIRSFGPAGGPIWSLKENNGIIFINDAPLLYAQTAGEFGAVSYEQECTDVSTILKEGLFPNSRRVEDPSTWASGAMRYQLTLDAGETEILDFAAHLHRDNEMFTWLKDIPRPLDLDRRRREAMGAWDRVTSVSLNVPDCRFEEAFYAQIAHLYMFSGLNSPRISPITYPTWWIRDSAYICVALEKAGLYDFAKRCAMHAGRFMPTSGFGAEGDNYGGRIWIISEHYLLTRDIAFLRDHFSYIEENAQHIIDMRYAKHPLKDFSELFCHQMCISPNVAFSCAPAENGLIMGRMDFEYPMFYVNSFCYLGLKRAAMCAEVLGYVDIASKYRKEGDKLRKAMRAYAQQHFGKNARDTCTAFTPSGWINKEDTFILEAFEHYWHTKWCPNGIQTHERLWTYFEIGDARNRIFIGERERAWKILDYYLDTHTCPGLYTYHEGSKDENSISLAWEKVRGWDKSRFVTPHGWSAAEMLALLRDCLVREDEKGNIILGSGVPVEWMNEEFSIDQFPTYYGEVSYRYDPKSRSVFVSVAQTHPYQILADFPMAVDIVNLA